MITVGNHPGEATPDQMEGDEGIPTVGLGDGTLRMTLGLTYTPGMCVSEVLVVLCEVLVEVLAEKRVGLFCDLSRGMLLVVRDSKKGRIYDFLSVGHLVCVDIKAALRSTGAAELNNRGCQ
jgi:hypothetical protein